MTNWSDRKLTCKFCISDIGLFWLLIIFITHNIHVFCFSNFCLCKIVKEFFLRIYDCFRVYKKIVLYYDVHMFSFWCNNRMYPLNHLTVFHVCMSWRMFVSFYYFSLFCESLFGFVKYFSYICKWRVFWDFCLLDAKYIQ